MCTRDRFALLVPVVFVAALVAPAADPLPLLKPATPAKGQLRLRLAVSPGFPKSMQFPVQVPNGKKRTQLMDAVVALDTLPGVSYITAKKLESWGYDVKGKEFVLPELFVPATQIAPKPKGGTDAIIRLTNLKLNVIDAPASSDNTVFFSDLSLCSTTLYQGGERNLEPRLSFSDKFLELTVPAAIVKRPGTDDITAPESTVNSEATLVPAFAPTVPRGGMPVFSFASLNGQDSYKMPNGTVIPVNVAVSSISNVPTGVVVTIGLARGCKIELDQATGGMAATGVDTKSEFIPGKIKELRLAVNTGPGMKTVKDIVIKDLAVSVDKNQTEGYMLLGQKFMDTYFADAVYAADKDGWKLHGRIAPDLLFDIKTRKKPEVKKQ